MNTRNGATRREILQRSLIGGVELLGLLAAGCSAPTAPRDTPPVVTTSPVVSPTAKPSGAAPTQPPPAGKPPTPATPQPAAKTIDLNALEQAAKREGKVTFYGSLTPSSQQELIGAFQQRFGFPLEGVRLASGPLAQRFAAEAEADNVVADVFQVNDPVFFEEAVKKNWITRVDELPALQQWPKQYWFGAYGTVAVSAYNVAYNTNLVKEPDVPGTWPGLLDPRWKSKMLLIDPRNTPSVLAMVHFLREQFGADFLKRLAAQDLRLVSSGVPGGQQLAAGAGELLFPSNTSNVVGLQAEGAPVADKLMEPSTGTELYAGVSTKAPHPNAARLLLNYLLTPEGQAVIVKGGWGTILPNIPGAQAMPKSYQSPKIPEALARKDELLGLLGVQ